VVVVLLCDDERDNDDDDEQRRRRRVVIIFLRSMMLPLRLMMMMVMMPDLSIYCHRSRPTPMGTGDQCNNNWQMTKMMAGNDAARAFGFGRA